MKYGLNEAERCAGVIDPVLRGGDWGGYHVGIFHRLLIAKNVNPWLTKQPFCKPILAFGLERPYKVAYGFT